MPVSFRVLVCLALFGAGAVAAQDDAALVRVRIGDDARWAAPDWDDRDWTQQPLFTRVDTAAVLWMRADVETTSPEALAVSASALAAREVYWDGVLLGRVGRVGSDRASERAGPVEASFMVPDSLAAPGPHVIALRLSTFRRPAGSSVLITGLRVGDARELATEPLRSVGLPLLFLGGFVLIALYYGTLFAADRRRTPYLLTALLCLSVAGLLVAESWRPVIGYPYDLHGARLRVVEALTVGVGLLLVGTFAVQYRMPNGAAWVAAIGAASVALLAGIEDHETGTYAVFALSLTAAVGWTAWSAWRRQPGAWLALAGAAVCLAALIATGDDFMEHTFFPAFGVLLAGLLMSLGYQTREARRRHARALAEAARLDAELLKKHLQPHFLLNSLTSVMEWVERDPAQGALAMEALADELRALSEVSGERLIPMAHEVALCRAHLDVMGFRHDIQFEFDAEGVDLSAVIPPAILHTLVENAITHNAYPSGVVTLTLREAHVGTRRTLTLRAPLAGTRRAARPEGGGLRYIRARLEESLPGEWALDAASERGDWVTRIDLPGGGAP